MNTDFIKLNTGYIYFGLLLNSFSPFYKKIPLLP